MQIGYMKEAHRKEALDFKSREILQRYLSQLIAVLDDSSLSVSALIVLFIFFYIIHQRSPSAQGCFFYKIFKIIRFLIKSDHFAQPLYWFRKKA